MGYFLGCLSGIIIMSLVMFYDDMGINFIENYVEKAHKVCEPYEGPKSFDFNGTITCNDGTSVK